MSHNQLIDVPDCVLVDTNVVILALQTKHQADPRTPVADILELTKLTDSIRKGEDRS